MNVKHRKVIEILNAFLSSKRNRRRKRKKMTVISISIILSIIFLMIFPSFVNWIVTYNGDKFRFLIPKNGISQNNQWVGFIASYSGSIIGGLISGLITLGGVLLTLKKGEKDEEIKSYPSKRKAILNLHNQFKITRSRIDKYLYCDFNETPDLLVPLKIALEIYLEELEILTEIAMEINGYTFLSILDFKDDAINLVNAIDTGELNKKSKTEIENIFLGFKFASISIEKSIEKENREYLNKMEDIILSKKI